MLGVFENGPLDKKGFDATRWVSLAEIVEELDVTEGGELETLFQNFEATIVGIRDSAFDAERQRRKEAEDSEEDDG